MEIKEEKKVPIKNYIILGIIFIISIGLTVYLCNWYKVYDEYQRQIPVIRGTLSEITAEEVDHYILDNPTTILYMCTSDSLDCRNYEKNFKKLIESKELQDSIIYVNLSNTRNSDFIDKFNNNYNYKYKIKLNNDYPALVVFKDGSIVNILQGTKEEKLTISKTKHFIEMSRIGIKYE